MKKHLTIWARFAVLAALLSGAACWGDVEIVGDPVVGGSAITPQMMGTSSLEPAVCELDDVRCDGPDLKRCVSLGNGQPKAWLTIQHCASAALCHESPARCEQAACAFGEIRCAGAEPERCSEDLTSRQQLGTCASAAYCSPVAAACEAENKQAPCCLNTPCAPGELRCNNGQLERCRVDQTGLDPVVTCATQKLCELSLEGCQGASCACQPPACEAGTSRCTGATLERCNADQTDWELVDECTTPELCELGRSKDVVACEIEKCDPGAHRCTGALLEICNAGQTDFDPVQNCLGGPAFCDLAAGACSDVPCGVGDMRCNGAQVERCRQDQSGFDSVTGSLCATPQLCSVSPQGAATCTPQACAANEFRCASNQPQRCNAGQTAFANTGSACPRADLCSVARQRCDFCVPSRRECTPDLRSSRTCSPDGNSFGPLTFCPLGCVAATGACQTCTPGELRCQGGLLSRCAPDGVSFTALNRAADCVGTSQVSCNGNQVQTLPCGTLGCNLQRSACNECSGQQRSCTDTRNFVSCQPDGTFGPATPCGNGLQCISGTGQCACTPGEFSCSADTLLVCNGGGNNLVPGARCSGTNGNVLRSCGGGQLTLNTCVSAALCNAATGAGCPDCIEGERSCVAGQPQVCTNGQRVPAAACGAGFSCEGAGLCRCTAGDVRCIGGALVQCAQTRQSFGAAAACVGATLRSCDGNTRVDEECGSNDLCLESTGGVCAACLASDPTTCSADATSEFRCLGGQLQENVCAALDLCVDGVGCVTSVVPTP